LPLSDLIIKNESYLTPTDAKEPVFGKYRPEFDSVNVSNFQKSISTDVEV
jgi:hypothetical protein